VKDDESQLQNLARFSGHGLTLALATGLFLLAGWWVDGRLGTVPLFTILGAMLGAGAGFYSLLQHLIFLPREEEKEGEGKGVPPPENGGDG
jgi:ATP synthase protein I